MQRRAFLTSAAALAVIPILPAAPRPDFGIFTDVAVPPVEAGVFRMMALFVKDQYQWSKAEEDGKAWAKANNLEWSIRRFFDGDDSKLILTFEQKGPGAECVSMVVYRREDEKPTFYSARMIDQRLQPDPFFRPETGESWRGG